jgi:hypothetical protein
MDGSLWPQRWFIRNTSNDLLTDRITDQTVVKNDLVTSPKPAVTFPNSAVTMPKRPVTMDRNTHQWVTRAAIRAATQPH